MNRVFLLTITSFLIFSCSEAVDEALYLEINGMNANTPIRIDEMTVLNSIYMNGDNIIYKYSVDTDGEDEIFRTAEFQRIQREFIFDLYCYHSDTQIFRDFNKSLTYSYYSDYGAFLTEITLFPSDCQ